jgi:hypothetical protein
MDMMKESRHVTLRYEAWKVPLVKSGACRQTVRKNGKAKVGDTLMHADKDGRMLCADVCTATRDILFADKSRWVIDGEQVSLNTRHAVARADGFGHAFDLAAFVQKTYGFPFHGTVICW